MHDIAIWRATRLSKIDICSNEQVGRQHGFNARMRIQHRLLKKRWSNDHLESRLGRLDLLCV
jgi:hypothetical protein